MLGNKGEIGGERGREENKTGRKKEIRMQRLAKVTATNVNVQG